MNPAKVRPESLTGSLSRSQKWPSNEIENGLEPSLVPWSVLWVRNSLAQTQELRQLLMTGQIRGAVSALGFLLLLIGMLDFVDFCRALRER